MRTLADGINDTVQSLLLDGITPADYTISFTLHAQEASFWLTAYPSLQLLVKVSADKTTWRFAASTDGHIVYGQEFTELDELRRNDWRATFKFYESK